MWPTLFLCLKATPHPGSTLMSLSACHRTFRRRSPPAFFAIKPVAQLRDKKYLLRLQAFKPTFGRGVSGLGSVHREIRDGGTGFVVREGDEHVSRFNSFQTLGISKSIL